MGKKLTKKEAVKFLGLDEKTFENYFKNAEEFRCLERWGGRGRYFFDQEELERWMRGYKWRTVELGFEDYVLCLDFALAQHFRGYVLSDWGTGRQREFGQKVTNWVKGQLAEVAVKKFLKKEFGIEVELDFRIYEQIVPQDIIGVIESGKKREPRIGIGIKSSKPKSAYLVLSENEVVLPERRSDVYLLCRPDIPDDHLLRLGRDQIVEAVKNQQHYARYKNEIPYFGNMFCEVAGWCRIEELEKVTEIPGQKFTGIRFVKKSGELHKDNESWEELLEEL